jgi:hypothetical protein
MSIGIENFIATYPLIEDRNFNQIIYNKKEFRDLELGALPEPLSDIQGSLLKHQILISRFLASYTPYDELLLWHSVGTGKSVSLFGATEAILRQTARFKHITIIAKNEAQVMNLTSELVTKAVASGTYPYADRGDMNQPLNRKKIFLNQRKAIQHKYTLDTHETFFKHLRNKSDELIKKQYSNQIIVIDEVHNLSDKKSLYTQAHRLLHLIDNRKIILMTATPIVNYGIDLVQVMNLILPLNKQMTKIDITSEARLVPFIKGRVSYLQSRLENVQMIPMGDSLIDNTLKVMVTTFQGTQRDGYELTLGDENISEDRIVGSFGVNLSQASLFVFPDKTSGISGSARYITNNKLNDVFFNECKDIGFPLRGVPIDEALDNLNNFSCKYTFIIRNLLQNPRKNAFVYMDLIRGSGADVFASLLNLFNISNVVIKGESQHVTDTVASFNKYDNRFGKYIRVLIGGVSVKEGLSFKNIQLIHIATPHFNMSGIDQAIGRGVRFRSHDALLEDVNNVDVLVYRHVSIMDDNRSFNVDVWKYETAVTKDRESKLIEYIIKTHAFDCALNIQRNTLPAEFNNTRLCEYKSCDYNCSNVNMNEPIDWSTFNIYYGKMDTSDIINNIKRIFLQTMTMTIVDLVDQLQSFSDFLVIESVRTMITTHTPIINRYGFRSYLKEHHGVLFLTSNAIDPATSTTDRYYTEYITIQSNESFSNLIAEIELKAVLSQLDTIKSLPLEQKIAQIERFPQRYVEFIIESTIVRVKIDKKPETELNKWVLNTYATSIKEIGNIWVSTYIEPKQIYVNDEWVDITPNIEELLTVGMEDHERSLIHSDYDFYGIVDNTGFKIRDIRPPVKLCTEIRKKFHILIMFHDLDIAPHPDADSEVFGWSRNKCIKALKQLRELDLQSLSDDTLRDLAFWNTKTKDELCDVLTSYFATQQPPPTTKFRGTIEDGKLLLWNSNLDELSSTGLTCGTGKMNLPGLLRIVAHFNVPTERESPSSRQTNIAQIAKKGKREFNESELDAMSDEELENLGYWATKKITDICIRLRRVFEDTTTDDGFSLLVQK